jgi:hypothetical protein
MKQLFLHFSVMYSIRYVIRQTKVQSKRPCVCLYIIEEFVNISCNLHFALFGFPEILNERFYVKRRLLEPRTIHGSALVGSDFGGFSA